MFQLYLFAYLIFLWLKAHYVNFDAKIGDIDLLEHSKGIYFAAD